MAKVGMEILHLQMQFGENTLTSSFFILDKGADIKNKFIRNAIYETKVEILIILCSYDDEYSCNQANPNSTS